MSIFTSFLLAALLSVSPIALAAQTPETSPSTAPAPSSSPSGPAPSSASSSSKGKTRPIPSFLIVGTIFNEKALSFPGVQIRIRRSNEKKYRWETYTDSRGEFAVRVPPGIEYELIAHVKNYQDASQNVDSKVDVLQRVSIKLIPREKAKAGAKP